MKNLITSIEVKLALKSLVANGYLKNLHLQVEGNSLTIGEVTTVDNNKDTKCNISFDKEKGGSLEISGGLDCKFQVKNLTIAGNKGQRFSVELLEFDSAGEAMELFASIMK